MDYTIYENMSLLEVATKMQQIKNELDDASLVKTTFQKEYDHIRLNVIPSLMDEDGINTVVFKDIGRLTLTSDIYAGIPAEKKEESWDWLRKNGHGDIIKETISAGTLKAVLKVIMKKGEQLPEELFKVTPFSRASITKIR